MFNKRSIIIVLDSVGVGELPDASDYGDEGSNTLSNTAHFLKGLSLINFQRLGLGNIIDIEGVPPNEKPIGCFGKMAEISVGKDSTTGHWEMAGLIVKKPFPTYPDGFPVDLISKFEKAIGRKVIGNKPASGTEIIKELGEKHIKSGFPIVYTSADSVFQIAAHKKVIPLNKLYEYCEIARNMLKYPHNISRVIARPFLGHPDNFIRTAERRDYSIEPPGKILLDYLKEEGFPVFGVGKIDQIYAGRGLTDCIHSSGNLESLQIVKNLLNEVKEGLIMANLVDFDMLWGHRNNPQDYAEGLKEVDTYIPEYLGLLKSDDIIIFTADHGCDPTTPSTDHSREYVPLLVAGPGIKPGINLGIRKSFADLGKTVAEYFNIENQLSGTSFLKEIFIKSA